MPRIQQSTKPTGAARHQFYRSKANGVIYPAMTGRAAGYEDSQPSEWEPATAAEYKAQERRTAEKRRAADVIDVAPVAPPPPNSED